MSVRMPAARNALRVIELVADQVGPVRAATVARTLDMPRSSAYQLLQVMREEGFLVHYPELGAFGPSAKVREIGSQVGAAARLERLGQPILDKLVAASVVPATAHLSVLTGRDVAYAARAQGHRAPTTVSRVGVRLPALATATGRAMLAALTPEQVVAVVQQLPSTGEVRTRSQLHDTLAEVRKHGFAREVGDVDEAYGSVAAAVFDAAAYPVASVGLTFRLEALDEPSWQALGDAVQESAAELTGRLGGRMP